MLPIASTPIGNTVAPNPIVTLPTDPVTATPSIPNLTALCGVTDPTASVAATPLITTLASQRFEDKLTSIGAYAAELDENDREAEMRSRSRAFTTALNSTGSGALGA